MDQYEGSYVVRSLSLSLSLSFFLFPTVSFLSSRTRPFSANDSTLFSVLAYLVLTSETFFCLEFFSVFVSLFFIFLLGSLSISLSLSLSLSVASRA